MKGSILIKIFSFLIIIFLLLPVSSNFATKGDKDKIPITTSSEEAKQDFLKGRDLVEKAKIHESIKYFESAIHKDKDFALAYYYHASVNPTTNGFFEDVEKAYSLKDKVSEGERLMIISLKAASDGNLKKQEEALIKLVELFPNDERVQNLLGVFHYAHNDYERSIEYLKKAAEINPEYSASYNLLGYAYQNLMNYREAEKAFTKYIDLIPDDPNPYDSYAELLMKEGKYEKSIEQYRKALSVDTNFIVSYHGIAANYNFMGKYTNARKELNKLLEKARDDSEKRLALFGMTVSYIDEGGFEKAIEEMKKQYKLGEMENDTGAMTNDLYTMGYIYFEAGKYDEAANIYDKALKTDLDSKFSDLEKENSKKLHLYYTARVLLMKDDLAGAKEKSKELNEKLNLSENIFQIWFAHELQGHIALKERDYKKAIREFSMSNMRDPYIYFFLGQAYQGAGDIKKAKEYFKIAANFNALNSMNQAFVRNKANKLIATL